MGIAMELNDVLGYCDYADVGYGSDLTDTESDVEEYEFTPRAFEQTVPRSSKRTYGVFVDSDAVGMERRKRSRIDEQIQLLRAAIPNLYTNEKASILTGAYEYIEKLQRQVLELHDELDSESVCSDDEEDDVSSCEDDLNTEADSPLDFNAVFQGSGVECREDSCDMVSVELTEGGLRIHIQCEKRPRVLADIMDFLESSGMNVDQVSIAYQEDSQFVFDCLGSKVDGKCLAGDRGHIEACLRLLVADQRDTASPPEI
ncbi:hypothetical protein KC19_8G160400 [Ceratodon purpureus]|uniref:BHLH domain-containing protein n=1 Tax=Ceratodon purpureus TaxID=3225 RepID=A0A8T0H154_CERPU|nr:hypothetical protein KC19_8G160400 [Ceratodon purpureus]